MKIIYLYDSLAIWGGIERVLIDKMNYLVSIDGFEVYVATANQGNHPIPYQMDKRIHHIDFNIGIHNKYRYAGIKRLQEGRRLNKLYRSSLKALLSDVKPDILICTASQDVCSLLKIKGSIPLLVESHANFIHPDKIWRKLKMLINNFWIGKANSVITLTEGDARSWRKVSKDVHVIPNIVHLNDTGRLSDCSSKRAIFVGRFAHQKGIGSLYDMWSEIHKRHPDWQLDLYGDGEEWDYYYEKARLDNININVYKPVSDIFRKYQDASMLLMTSLYEPFGLVMPEAMSCGLPVVAFDCPYGPGEMIKDNKNGYLIKMGDKEGFIDSVCSLITNTELRQQMGNVARQSVDRYSANNILPLWLELFKSFR